MTRPRRITDAARRYYAIAEDAAELGLDSPESMLVRIRGLIKDLELRPPIDPLEREAHITAALRSEIAGLKRKVQEWAASYAAQANEHAAELRRERRFRSAVQDLLEKEKRI